MVCNGREGKLESKWYVCYTYSHSRARQIIQEKTEKKHRESQDHGESKPRLQFSWQKTSYQIQTSCFQSCRTKAIGGWGVSFSSFFFFYFSFFWTLIQMFLIWQYFIWSCLAGGSLICSFPTHYSLNELKNCEQAWRSLMSHHQVYCGPVYKCVFTGHE